MNLERWTLKIERRASAAVPAFILFLSAIALPAPAQTAPDPQAFFAAKAESALARSETSVAGTDGWRFLAAELRHLGAGPFWGDAAPRASRATRPDRADPLPAIIDFHRQLQSAGVELWLVPVPPKALAVSTKLGAPENVSDWKGPYDEFFALLRRQGITVVDLRESWTESDRESLYCQTDSHWSGAGILHAAQLLAGRAKTNSWYGGISRQSFATHSKEVAFKGDLAANGDLERQTLRFVGTGQAGQLTPVPPSDTSPIVLLGDSHNLVFHAGDDMHARGAGLPDQLAAELGFPVDLVAVRGSGATPARVNLMRRARRSPGWWSTRKLVIWCFAAREFTESDGWARVPVVAGSPNQ